MKTLSSNVTVGKRPSQGHIPVYLVQLSVLSRANWYPGSTNWQLPTILQWSTKDTNDITGWAGTRFYGNIIQQSGLGIITQSVDIEDGGNIGRIGDFVLSLANREDYSEGQSLHDYLNTLYFIEGSTFELRVCFEGPINTPTWADALPLFKGKVDKMVWSYDTIELHIKDSRYDVHRLLPKEKIDEKLYPGLSPEMYEYYVPIHYGDMAGIPTQPYRLHKRLLAKDNQGAPSEAHPVHLAKGYIIKNTRAFMGSYIKALFCSHNILEANDYIYVYDKANEGYRPTAMIWSTLPELIYENGHLIIKHNLFDITYKKCFIPNFLSSINNNDTVYNAINEEWNDWTEIEEGDDINYHFSDRDDVSTKPEGQNVIYKLDYSTLNFTAGSSLKVDLIDHNTILETFTFISGISANRRTLFYSSGEVELPKYTIRMQYQGQAGTTFRIRNLYAVVIGYNEKIEYTECYTPLKGRIWEHEHRWLMGVGMLIQRPSYIIESILRDELGVAVFGIDTATFDSVTWSRIQSGCAEWLYAGGILDKTNSKNVIANICKQFGLIYFIDYQGKHTVRLMRDISTIGDLPTIWEDVYGATATTDIVKMVKSDRGLEVKFEFDKIPLDKVYNEFFLNYKLNYATGKYDKTKYLKSPDQVSYTADLTNLTDPGGGIPAAQTLWNTCRGLYRQYGIVQRYERDCDGIRTDEAAENLLRWLVLYFANRKIETSIETGLQLLHLELGDVMDVTHLNLTPSDKVECASMMTGWQLNPSTSQIKTTWLEMPAGLY